jgi:hypothetical protein
METPLPKHREPRRAAPLPYRSAVHSWDAGLLAQFHFSALQLVQARRRPRDSRQRNSLCGGPVGRGSGGCLVRFRRPWPRMRTAPSWSSDRLLWTLRRRRPVVVGVAGLALSDAAVAFAFDAASVRGAPLVPCSPGWTSTWPGLDPAADDHRLGGRIEADEHRVLAELSGQHGDCRRGSGSAIVSAGRTGGDHGARWSLRPDGGPASCTDCPQWPEARAGSTRGARCCLHD